MNDSFELVYDGNMFNVLWEQEKRKNSFNWDNKARRHDPFEVHAFGDKVNKIMAPTTREAGSRAAMEMQALDMNREESKDSQASTSSPAKKRDIEGRNKALKELEEERKQMESDLRSGLGGQEAEDQIRVYLVSTEKPLSQHNLYKLIFKLSVALLERYLQES